MIWGLALKTNKVLVHLDLSYCKFELKDTEQISNDLNENHTLVGFHYQGNFGVFDAQQGKVDSNGFLRLVDAYENTIEDVHIPIVPTDGSPTRTIQKNKLRSLIKDPSKANPSNVNSSSRLLNIDTQTQLFNGSQVPFFLGPESSIRGGAGSTFRGSGGSRTVKAQ